MIDSATAGVTLVGLLPIVAGWAIAVASPGPATLAIISAGLSGSRREAFATAAGVLTGSTIWAVSAGLGLGALMATHSWSIEILRYLGAGWLGWLAIKSARAAARPGAVPLTGRPLTTLRRAWARGLMIHLTNPKAILFWAALFAVIVSPEAPGRDILLVGSVCLGTSVVILTGFALIFSAPRISRAYLKGRRLFDGLFAAFFGFAALKILTARLA